MKAKWVPLYCIDGNAVNEQEIAEFGNPNDMKKLLEDGLLGKTIRKVLSYNPIDGDMLVIEFEDGSSFAFGASSKRRKCCIDFLLYYY